MQNILITGGAGFVGSRLALGLRERNDTTRVTALDNLKRRGAELNIPRLKAAGVEFIHGDIRNPEDLQAAGDADLVIECSAEPSVLSGYDGSPAYLLNTNLFGAVNCFEYARSRGAGVIFLSTSRVYPHAAINALPYVEQETRFTITGEYANGLREDFPLEGPRSLYGATKLCSECLLREYQDMYGVKSVINRCGVLAGPWQMGKIDQGVVVLWVARHIYGGRLGYIGFGGQGKQVRDMLHIDDLLDLVLYEIEHLDQINGSLFNAGGGLGVSASLLELTNICREITRNEIPIGADPEDRPADIRSYITDNTHVTQKTSWKPQRDIHRLIEDIAIWIRDNQEALRPILA
jgi:CDP-paratose 2-epimerase